MITKVVIFAFFVGALTGPIVWAALALVKKFKLAMTWWKWMLAILWYFLLIFSVLLSFTMVGEGEEVAGMKILLFLGVILLILGVGLFRIILSRPKKDTQL